MSKNRIYIVGRLTALPEIRVTPGVEGKRVAQFSIAQNYRTGEKSSEVNYFDCEAWDPFVRLLEAGGRTGRPIMVDGWIKTKRWKDEKSQQNRSKQFVSVQYFHFIDFIALEPKGDAPEEELDADEPND